MGPKTLFFLIIKAPILGLPRVILRWAALAVQSSKTVLETTPKSSHCKKEAAGYKQVEIHSEQQVNLNMKNISAALRSRCAIVCEMCPRT